MANLIGMPRAAWRRQPQCFVDIDTNDSLGSRCILAINFATGLAAQRSSTNTGIITGALPYIGNEHRGYGFNTLGTGTNSKIVYATSININPTRLTVFSRHFIVSEAASNGRLYESVSSSSFLAQSGGDWSRAVSGSLQYAIPFGLEATKGYRTVAISYPPPGTVPESYINGLPVGNSASGTGIGNVIAVSGLVIGNRNSNDRPLSGAMYSLLFFDSNLDKQDILRLHYNEWSIFKPRIARFISIPSTGPVTFKPYWARRRSLIIGSGV
jgi:hypothetical protein